jgi:outer membrane biosynthesis protein TonB
MKTPLRLLVYLFLVNIITAQTSNTCTSEVVVVEDLNSIDKCKAINKQLDKKNKPERQIFLKLSHSNSRFLRKRKPDVISITKAKEAVKAISELDAKGLKSNTKTTISNNKLVEKKLSTSVFKLTEVDFIPVFDSCKEINDISILKCFKSQIGKHIQNNFEYPEEAIDDNITGKITVQFLFDKDGKIKIDKVIDENENKILGEYTKNLILKLPSFRPAKKNGLAVPLSYELSLDFSL